MHDRPWGLDRLHQQFLYQTTATSAERRAQAQQTMRSSDDFRQTAGFAIDADLVGSAVSNLHESARLAITAHATADGYRFNSAQGGHAAVDDYGLAAGLVDKRQWAQLDTLRELRNANNYPADIAAPPTKTEVVAIAALVDHVRSEVARRLTPRRPIPPPPGR
jgi:hypothetical protein